MRKFIVVARIEVEVTINDENVIDRVVNNEDGWQEHLYPFTTAEQVVEMLAFNHVVNSVTEANQLDGWGDMPKGVVSFRMEHSDFDVQETGAARR